VRAADRHALLQAHELGQELRPRDHGDARGAGGCELGVGLRDRGGEHDHVGAADVRGVVAERHGNAEPAQARQRLARAHVRAGHAVAARVQDLGEARHAGAADPDEVHASHAALHGRPSSA
jgi:hypothetical protein